MEGAFDHVDSNLLLDRCAAIGLNTETIQLLRCFCSDRVAKVVVGGSESNDFCLKDMVYQGTVLGPFFWNVFFAPTGNIIAEHGMDVFAFAFADDLNAMVL